MNLTETQKQHISNYLSTAAEKFKEIAIALEKEMALMPIRTAGYHRLIDQFNMQYREASEFADIFMNCESVTIEPEPTYSEDDEPNHSIISYNL